MMLSRRTKIGISTAALLTAIIGTVNLLSSVTPGLEKRVEWLEVIFPFEVRAGGHIFAALSGFFLLALASNLWRRKRVAWLLTVLLLIISIISHIVKGIDIEESLLAMILLGQLLLLRKAFTARSDIPSITQGVRALIGALLFTIAYGTAGFFLLDKHYQINFNFWQALKQTLAMFLTSDNAGLQPIVTIILDLLLFDRLSPNRKLIRATRFAIGGPPQKLPVGWYREKRPSFPGRGGGRVAPGWSASAPPSLFWSERAVSSPQPTAAPAPV